MDNGGSGGGPAALTAREAREVSRLQEQWSRLGPAAFPWADKRGTGGSLDQAEAQRFFDSGRTHFQELEQRFVARDGAFRGARALDFGCGPGRYCFGLSQRYSEVVGVDVSGPTIRRAQDLYSDRPGVRFEVNADADLHRFASGDFDLVWSAYVFQHDPPWLTRRFLREFYRVLRPRGQLLVQLHGAVTWPVLRRLPPAWIYRPVNWLNRRLSRGSETEIKRRWDTYWIRPRDVEAMLGSVGFTPRGSWQEPVRDESQGRLLSYWYFATKDR